MQMLCQFLLADRLTNIFAMNHSDDANDGLAHRVGYTFIFAMNHSNKTAAYSEITLDIPSFLL